MKIAIAQISTGKDVVANLNLVRTKIDEAAQAGAELVVFPEATMRAFGFNLTSIAEPLDGPFASGVREAARSAGATAVVGMFTPQDAEHVRNTLLITGPDGTWHYDKIHLFDAFGYSESDTVSAGDEPLVVTIAGQAVGFATCYDIRFPELFTHNARRGAQISVVCASWGSGEGKVAQWRLLAQARALDSTSFVIACDQADPTTTDVDVKDGAPTGVGHSMVVAPDGTVVAEAGEAPQLLVVDLDVAQAERTRAAIPVLENARLR